LNDVDALNALVFAAGYGDLGSAWERTKVQGEMSGIAALSDRNVWAVGDDGRSQLIRHFSC
jgi:hypothetical protein